MDKILAAIMEQLNMINVHGDDVERMFIAKNMIRQLQKAFMDAKAAEEQPQKE